MRWIAFLKEALLPPLIGFFDLPRVIASKNDDGLVLLHHIYFTNSSSSIFIIICGI
jgi:hypothetical protein